MSDPTQGAVPGGDPCADAHVDCAEVLRHVQDVLDNNGDVEVLVQWTAHLRACPPCGAELEVYERITAVLRERQCCCPDDVAARLAEFGRRICAGDEPVS